MVLTLWPTPGGTMSTGLILMGTLHMKTTCLQTSAREREQREQRGREGEGEEVRDRLQERERNYQLLFDGLKVNLIANTGQ